MGTRRVLIRRASGSKAPWIRPSAATSSGAAKLAAPRSRAAVEAWLAGFDVRPWSLETTHHYAQIWAVLERAGKPTGGVGLMIAAHAMAEDSVLITNNASELLCVPGLVVEEWAIETPSP